MPWSLRLLIFLLCLHLLGCNQSSHSTLDTVGAGSGDGCISFTVQWPEVVSTRAIPLDTTRIEITAMQDGRQVGALTLPRESGATTATGAFERVAPRKTTLTAYAYNAKGRKTARAVTSVTVASGQTATATLELKRYLIHYVYDSEINSSGSGDREVFAPETLAIDAYDRLYVADYGNNRIKVMDTAGNLLWAFPCYCPLGIALDKTGNIYVAGLRMRNSTDYMLRALDKSGALRWSAIKENCSAVTVDNDGMVYTTICNHQKGRMDVHDPNGTLVNAWDIQPTVSASGVTAWSVASDANGRIYTGIHFIPKIYVHDGNGNLLSQLATPGTGEGEFTCVYQVAIQYNPFFECETIFVTDHEGRRAFVLTLDGEYLGQIGSGIHGSGPDQLLCSHGIAADSKGNVYITDRAGCRIVKYVPTYIDSDLMPAPTPRSPSLQPAGCRCHARISEGQNHLRGH